MTHFPEGHFSRSQQTLLMMELRWYYWKLAVETEEC